MPTYRQATVDDLEILTVIAENTFREAWQDQNDPVEFEKYCALAFAVETLRREILHSGSEFYLIYDEQNLAAYIKLNFGRNRPELGGEPGVQIERIYVEKSFRGRGLGAEIMKFIGVRARREGAWWLWLSVWEKSPRSIRFYEKNGFSIFGTEVFRIGDDPQTDWLMKRRL